MPSLVEAGLVVVLSLKVDLGRNRIGVGRAWRLISGASGFGGVTQGPSERDDFGRHDIMYKGVGEGAAQTFFPYLLLAPHFDR